MDLNFAVKSQEDQRFLNELPKDIRISVSKILHVTNVLCDYIDL